MKELTLDSNVFIRYFIQDTEEQFLKAKEIFEFIENDKLKAAVSILVINEVIWILENYYQLERKTYIPRLVKLLYLKRLDIIEVKKELILDILEKMTKLKFDFTDIYLSQIAKKEQVFSFDQDFEKLYKN